MWILRNSQQTKLGSLQRKWKVPRQLHTISASGWWPTSCTNQFNKALVHRNIISKTQEEKIFFKPKQPNHKNVVHENPQASSYNKKSFDPKMYTRIRIGIQSVEIPHMWKDFSALQRNSNLKFVTSLDISLVFVIKRSKHPSSLKDQRLINYKQEQCMHKREPFAVTLKITVPVMIPFACRSKCSTHKVISRRFPSQHTLKQI